MEALTRLVFTSKVFSLQPPKTCAILGQIPASNPSPVDNAHIRLRAMDRLIRKIKGKGKEPEITLPKLMSPDRLSRVHLMVDPDNPTRYSYHLNPLMPALYNLLVEDEKALNSVLENTSTILLRVSDGREVGNIIFDREFQEGQLHKVLGIDLENGVRVFVQASFQPNRILARWSMELTLFGHKNSSDQSESTSFEDVSDQNNVPAKKADRAVAVARSPLNKKSTQDDIPPPPYEESRPPPEYELGFGSKEQYQALPVYISNKAETSQPHPEKHKNYEPFPNPPATWGREAEFMWEQVSSRARMKLVCPARKEMYAEFIQETDVKKIADGVKGQLLFRKSFGQRWEMAVLLTLGMLIELSKGKVWDE